MNANNNDEISTFEQETKNNFEMILSAIGEMRRDITNRFDNVELRLGNIESRIDNVESRLDKIEAEQTALKNDFYKFKEFVEVQFEAVRQGIVKNYNQFDRLVSEISQNRSVIYSTKAELGELHEKVYLLSKSGEQALK